MNVGINRVETPYGRVYVFFKSYTDFICMPSVNTVLSIEESSYLAELEKSMGAEKLKALGEKAMLRGSAMHCFLENYFIAYHHNPDHEKALLYTQKKSLKDLENNFLPEDIKLGRDLFYNLYLKGVVKQVKRVLFSEKILYSLKHKVGGTGDFGFENQKNLNILVDFKSSNSIRDISIVNKYKKQIAGYAICYEEIYNKIISRGQVWISNPHDVQIELISTDELEIKKEEFIELSQKFHSVWDERVFRNHIKHLDKF